MYTCQREQVHSAENIQYRLHQQHRRSTAGTYRIECGSARHYVHDREDCQCDDAEHQQHGYYEAPLLHYKSEYKVSAGRSYILELAVAGSETEQSAACAE